jgi:hypothetical protein
MKKGRICTYTDLVPLSQLIQSSSSLSTQLPKHSKRNEESLLFVRLENAMRERQHINNRDCIFSWGIYARFGSQPRQSASARCVLPAQEDRVILNENWEGPFSLNSLRELIKIKLSYVAGILG